MGNCKSNSGSIETDKEKENDIFEQEGVPSEKTLMKKRELKSVLEADSIKWQEGDTWYVVEAAWVQRWLAYVEGGDSVKKPGPIDNRTLLHFNGETNRPEPKALLRAARREHMGHYRRVNKPVWDLWCGRYEGSGPSIWVISPPFEDTSNWIVDPAFDWRTNGRDLAAGAGGSNEASALGGAAGVAPGSGGAGQAPSADAHLAKGEMEDDGVGLETSARAAAFFNGGTTGAAVAGTPASALINIGVHDGPKDPIPSSAEQWMYGKGDGDGLLME